MTLDEAVKVLNDVSHDGHDGWYVSGQEPSFVVFGPDQYDTFSPFEAIAIAEKHASAWISVDDDLPKHDEVVLIHTPDWEADAEHLAARFEISGDKSRFSLICCGQRAWDVSHWMRRPESPKD